MLEFPKYGTHNEVLCFSCSKSLFFSEVKASDYPAGRWIKNCIRCGLKTFYDIKNKEVLNEKN